MHFFSLFILLMLYSSTVQSHDNTLTPFGTKVDNLLPEDVKSTLFNQNYVSDEEIEEAVQIVSKKYEEVLGFPLDPRLGDKIEAAAVRLIESHQDGALFRSFTSGVSYILTHIGKLNSCNVDHLAQKYVKRLNKSAKRVTHPNSIESTLPALATITTRFLKSEGLTSKADSNEYVKYLIQEFDKYAKAKTDG